MSNWIAAEVAARFADAVPDGAPTDPVEKNAFLAALALHGLIQRGATGAGAAGRGSGRPEMTVVIDTSRQRRARRTRRRLGTARRHSPRGAGRPVRAIRCRCRDRAQWGRASRSRSHEPGPCDSSRQCESATGVAQPVPAVRDSRLPVRFDHCKIHHVVWWRHGGRTDLDNLLPVCFRHHRAIHHEGWTVELAADRTLVLTLPDGRVMSTGPPRRAAA